MSVKLLADMVWLISYIRKLIMYDKLLSIPTTKPEPVRNFMYTLLGEGTMAKPACSNAFSWKWGFLVNNSQLISNRNDYANVSPKGLSSTASLDIILAQYTYQWKILTIKSTVATTAGANNQTTYPASLATYIGLEEAFQTAHTHM